MTRFWYGAFGLGLAVVLAAGGAFADDKKDDKKDERPARPGAGGFGFGGGGGPLVPANVAEKLKLTDEQKGKVEKLQKELEEKTKDKTASIRETMQKARESGDRDAIRKATEEMRTVMEDVRKIRTDLEGKVKAVLSDEQKKTFDTAMADRPRGFGGAGGGFGGPGGFGGAGGFGGFGRPSRDLSSPAVQERLNLTAEQKEKLDKLKKEFAEKEMGLLTPEQKKKFEEIKNEQPQPGRRPGGPGTPPGGGRGTPPGGRGARPDF